MAREITVAQADAILDQADFQDAVADMVDTAELEAGESTVVESSGAFWAVLRDHHGNPDCIRCRTEDEARREGARYAAR